MSRLDVPADLLDGVTCEKTLVLKYAQALEAVKDSTGQSGSIIPIALAQSPFSGQLICFDFGVLIWTEPSQPLEIHFDLRCPNTVRFAVTACLNQFCDHRICDDPCYFGTDGIHHGQDAVLNYAKHIQLEQILETESGTFH